MSWFTMPSCPPLWAEASALPLFGVGCAELCLVFLVLFVVLGSRRIRRVGGMAFGCLALLTMLAGLMILAAIAARHTTHANLSQPSTSGVYRMR